MDKCEWCGDEKEGVRVTRVPLDCQAATGLRSCAWLCEACTGELLIKRGGESESGVESSESRGV